VKSQSENRHGHYGDFTASPRIIFIAVLAIAVGFVGAYLATALLSLINLSTNLFFFQRISTRPADPIDHHLGAFVILVPMAGALIIGVMARFGSERIRGHGIPEAIEAILVNGSRLDAKVALLKPLSSAISIGSGGPFGAEGPIIMTGGAFGSLIAQLFHLTSAERKTLLVAGAAAGMSATFAAPLAAVLLAVELLLFEWKPRSFIPVALASATAAIVRQRVLGMGPLFPVPPHPAFIGEAGLFGCVLAGLLAGMLSAILTKGVYAAEDAFQRLPMHWMWWPLVGGLTIGIGGVIFPRALGVGYNTIGDLLRGQVAGSIILGVLSVKATIWIVSLGSGTSGGVLAPLLMMGGALGGVEAMFLPNEGLGFWPLVSMGAILGGTMRSPLTAIVFAVELTHDLHAVIPLLVAVTVAHAFTVLVLRRSILTEKISRRGYHLSREYAVDPLEILFVREVMRTNIVALRQNEPVRSALYGTRHERHRQRLYPVLDAEDRLVGVVTHSAWQDDRNRSSELDVRTVGQMMNVRPVVAHPDEPLRAVAHRMAETGLTRLPVVDRRSHKVVGMIGLSDLLKGRAINLESERRRDRTGPMHLFFPGTRSSAETVHQE
jgi:CIC family chloride channel protein